jgi:hypothetical protein
MDFVYIQYRFLLAGEPEIVLRLRLDPNTFEAVEATPPAPPPWVTLAFHQCPNCPLAAGTQPHCPAALRLLPIVERCARLNPYAAAQIEVTTPERAFVAQRPLQKGLSSLLGLVIATSGCPRTTFLMPMARYHLPFATEEETLSRSASMYLLGQYFRARRGEAADLALDGLAALYRELQTVNTALAGRLRAAAGSDSAAQAMVSLDLLSHSVPFDIKSSLERLRRQFEPAPGR